jgi:hypothetical protein
VAVLSVTAVLATGCLSLDIQAISAKNCRDFECKRVNLDAGTNDDLSKILSVLHDQYGPEFEI